MELYIRLLYLQSFISLILIITVIFLLIRIITKLIKGKTHILQYKGPLILIFILFSIYVGINFYQTYRIISNVTNNTDKSYSGSTLNP